MFHFTSLLLVGAFTLGAVGTAVARPTHRAASWLPMVAVLLVRQFAVGWMLFGVTDPEWVRMSALSFDLHAMNLLMDGLAVLGAVTLLALGGQRVDRLAVGIVLPLIGSSAQVHAAGI